jgi:hypothetical protein
MRAESRKRISARKRIGAKYIARAITLLRASGTDITGMSWAVNVSGEPVPLVAYPKRQVAQAGICGQTARRLAVA